MLENPTSQHFGTTATPSSLTSNELDSLGFRRSKVICLEIISQNGRLLTDIPSIDLLTHFWTVLNQNPDNLQHIRSSQTAQQTYRIYYRVKELVHLPHISHEPHFDFYEILSQQLTMIDVKPIVFQCLLLGSAEPC